MTRRTDQEFYLKMPGGPPTQGDIWAGLPSLYLTPAQCAGIVVTPRCDLAHDKAPVFNYLPMLSVKDCLCREAGFRLLEREERDTRQSLRLIADSLGISQLLDVTDDLDRILESVAPAGDAKKQKTQKELVEKVARIKAIAQILNSRELPVTAIRDFIRKKALVQFKDDLIHNRIADLHFLPSCPPLFSEPQAVMIRYVAMCSRKFIHAAAACVNQMHWDEVRARESSVDFTISAYMPERLARLRSPFLESLMARFGSLFGRVGTRDIDPGYISEFLDKEI